MQSQTLNLYSTDGGFCVTFRKIRPLIIKKILYVLPMPLKKKKTLAYCFQVFIPTGINFLVNMK